MRATARHSNASGDLTTGYDGLGMGSEPTVTVLKDPDELAEAAARLVVDAAAKAVAARGNFRIALAGGETPRATYARLAKPPFSDRVDWGRTWVFFGDERAVAPEHPDSNYGMAHATLLSKVPVPAAQIRRIRAEADDPEVAAVEYAKALAETFGTRRGELPRFDLVLLGLGVDGHTASLFPGSPVLKEIFRTVAAVHAAAAAIPQRLTLTLPVLNAAGRVVFLVAGAEKAKVVKAVLAERAMLPAAMIRPDDGELVWLLDRAAASLLPAGGTVAMRIAVAADHRGFSAKEPVIRALEGDGHQVLDLGTSSTEPVDYPDYARAVGRALREGRAEVGVLICGSGAGVSIAANKLRGVRAALCHDLFTARQSREDDDANVLCLGARVVGVDMAVALAREFVGARFSGAERHARRRAKVLELESSGT